MNQYLAKSDGETIVQHTKNLIEQLDLLKKLYPDALNDEDWKLLKLACKYHDLGKMNSKFQKKLKNHHSKEPGEIPHALMSISLLPEKELKQEGYSSFQISALAYAIALHHNRNLDEISKDSYENEIQALNREADNFPFDELGLTRVVPHQLSGRYYTWNHLPGVREKFYRDFVLIKGLLNRLDYAASGHYPVESSPRIDVDENVLPAWKEKNPKANWNRLQEWTYEHGNESIVVVGQTGLGKTEGALRWLHNDKAFFLLPLKSAINSIYDRLHEVYAIGDDHLALLHSDMMAYLLQKDSQDFEEVERLVGESRALSKQLTVATLDQIFNFVFHYVGYESKLSTLGYSKVVIDEIQMYSPVLLSYIIYGLKLIQQYGGKFEVMTATLPPFILDIMKKEGLKFVQPEAPFLDDKLSIRHSVKVLNESITSDKILEKYHKNKILVVCNTVSQAQKMYDELKKQADQVHLIHSRFIRKDRAELEKEICKFGTASNKESGIWIGTQVVEASLDIDFDILFTELSELNGLFQRMGRCYRRRPWNGPENSYNVYIFNGGGKNPSGIRNSDRSVVDYGMYKLAKKSLENIDGPLSEIEKINLINKTYTTDNVNKECEDYLGKVDSTIHFLEVISDDHPKKEQVQKEFRNIQSIDVIPEQILETNNDEIMSALNILMDKNSKKEQKVLARNMIQNYTVAVPLWTIDQILPNPELEEAGFRVLSKNYPYDSERGLSTTLNTEEENGNFF